jgi:hypothetical protein
LWVQWLPLDASGYPRQKRKNPLPKVKVEEMFHISEEIAQEMKNKEVTRDSKDVFNDSLWVSFEQHIVS